MQLLRKKIMLIICFCIIVVFICGAIQIYAVFYNKIIGNVKLKNGTWNIEINKTEISKGMNKEFIIDNINITENEHVKPGKIAPGLSGNFEILISPKNTDVSVKYEISLNEENLSNGRLKIKSIKEVESNNKLIRTEKNTYTAIIPLEEVKKGKTNRIKIEIEWKNVEENNEEDTVFGSVEQNNLKIPITVRASQYLGEEINQYVEE
mgnify:CR=1 FL=1